jgi:uncharacterized membrane protein YkvA (DUF1232 family)
MISPILLQSVARYLAAHPRLMALGAFLYLVSPIDLTPEMFLGPIGFIDDIFVLLLPFILKEYARKLKGEPPLPGSRRSKRRDYYDTTAE